MTQVEPAVIEVDHSNGNTYGPTTIGIPSSTIRFTPKVTDEKLEVVMNATWTMAKALEDGDTTEFGACWQYATSKWYCNWILRIMLADDRSYDMRNVYASNVIPKVADFTENRSMKATSGWDDSKYTLISSCLS